MAAGCSLIGARLSFVTGRVADIGKLCGLFVIRTERDSLLKVPPVSVRRRRHLSALPFATSRYLLYRAQFLWNLRYPRRASRRCEPRTSMLRGATTDLVEEVEQERGVPRFRALDGFLWQKPRRPTN